MHNIFENDFNGFFFKKTGETLANYSSLGKFISAVLLNSAFKASGELFLQILKSLQVYL